MYYLLDATKDTTTNEYHSVLLLDIKNQKIKTFLLDKHLMNFSLEHNINIFHDKTLSTLIYTKKIKNKIIHTIKVFRKGDQTNLLGNEEFIKQLKNTDTSLMKI